MSRYTTALATLILTLAASTSGAVPIGVLEIQFTGLDLFYDGSAIYDATSSSGDNLNPAEADPLDTLEFTVNGSPFPLLTADIFADVYIPDVGPISNTDFTTIIPTTGATTGYFNLLIGSSDPVGQYLKLDTSSVTVIYSNVSSTVQFLFGGAIVDVESQNLPYDILVGTGSPVTVSFSTKVVNGTKVVEGTTVASFRSAGTGEVNALAVPEPALAVLLALGMLGSLLTRVHN